jgi:hypothetical protein
LRAAGARAAAVGSTHAGALHERLARWSALPLGAAVLVVGTALHTLLIAGIDRAAGTPLLSPGLVCLPLVAMLAYRWGWRHAAVAGPAAVTCVYFVFVLPLSRCSH